MRDFLKLLWHEFTCPMAATSATVRHTSAGRIYECGCDFAVWEVYD